MSSSDFKWLVEASFVLGFVECVLDRVFGIGHSAIAFA